MSALDHGADPAPNTVVCGAAGCRRDDDLVRVTLPDHGKLVLCRYHRKHFWRTSS